MMKYLLVLNLVLCSTAYGELAGGRPNVVSEGQNAFSGVVNPANAVWIADRFDIGTFWVNQHISIINHDNKPIFPAGKTDLTYRSKNLLTADAAIHKQFKLNICSKNLESSISLAAYTMPSFSKLRTENPLPAAGNTPVIILNRTDVFSAVFSLKLNKCHSIGFTIDYLYFSHRRDGFENSDNPVRSVSPGNVTNNGTDHSHGIGFGIGWRWNITNKLNFGAAWSKKSHCGKFLKYRGFEPHHAQNYVPQTAAAGVSYKFTPRLSGHVDVLWMNLGNLPAANDNTLSNGSPNLNKRGSDNSPGPGLQDATYINIGMGYKLNSTLSAGVGFSHRLKLPHNSNFLSHTYTHTTIYDVLSFGANYIFQKNNLFLGVSYGFRNKVSGFIPVGGGRFTGQKQNASLSLSWGYMY